VQILKDRLSEPFRGILFLAFHEEDGIQVWGGREGGGEGRRDDE